MTDESKTPEAQTPETPEPPRITRKELLWLAFFVVLVTALIWLTVSDVWGQWFSVEETEPEVSWMQPTTSPSIQTPRGSWMRRCPPPSGT